MISLAKRCGILFPMLAIAATGPACASGGVADERALTLDIEEQGDSVEIQLIANSVRAQEVEYAIELVGSSRSVHKGRTTIPADERVILSRLKTSLNDDWCATLDVTEQDGTSYSLTAGDCAATI